MKRVVLLVFSFFVALAARTADAQNVSVRDYDVPVSRASTLFANVNYSYDRDGTTTIANDGVLGADYRLFYESLPFAYSFNASGSWARTWVDNAFLTSYSLDMTGRIKKFVWKQHDLFGAITAREAFRKGDDQPATDVTIGIGWGRFIDATALRRAVRIDDALVKDRVTRARLPKKTMLRIAHIIQRQAEYRQLYGDATYKKYWYEAIEQAAQESGLLRTDTLGAVGVLRMDQVLFRENIGDRFFGYDVTVGVRYELTQARPDVARPAANADVTIRYARPIRWSIQVETRASVSSPMSSGAFGRAIRLSSTSGVLYELTNRVDFRLDYSLAFDRSAGSGRVRASHSVLPSFLFYIEDEVRLLAVMRLLRPSGEPWTQEFSLALSYKAL